MRAGAPVVARAQLVTRRRALRMIGGTALGASLIDACTHIAPPEAPIPTATAVEKPTDGGTLKVNLWTETPPTLDPYLTINYLTQEMAAFVYSRLLMSKKAPGLTALAYVMEGDLAESWSLSDDHTT